MFSVMSKVIYFLRWTFLTYKGNKFLLTSIIFRKKFLPQETDLCPKFAHLGKSCPTLHNFQNMHLREQHFQRYQGVFLHAHFKNFWLALLTYYHIYFCMFRNYHSTILHIALEISRSCIVHILSTFVTEQSNL